MNDMDLHKIMAAEENINIIFELVDDESDKALDKHAPLKQKTVTIREKNHSSQRKFIIGGKFSGIEKGCARNMEHLKH